MSPHPKHLDDPFVFDDLIHQTVLNIDTARVCAAQIPEQLLKRRRPSIGIVGENVEKLLRFWTETRRSEAPSVLLILFCEDELPGCHQPGSLTHRSIGVASPSAMDSRMPGTERRYRVSWIEFQSSSPIRTAFERGPVISTGS
jgi:hypothetical protein